jgi:CRP-like cAMP-binding protein
MHSVADAWGLTRLSASNHFLSSLNREDSERLRPHLRHLKLAQGAMLYATEDIIAHAYFPLSCVISHVIEFADAQWIEADMVGRDSLAGASATLGGAPAINRAVVAVAGEAQTIDIDAFRDAVHKSETLRAVIARHQQLALAHSRQTAACNATHSVEQRLSRWLLQARDLVGTDTVPLTQEFLAVMLAVQRSSLTGVAQRLQKNGLIAYRRGKIFIADPEGLNRAACECYGAIKRIQERVIGWSPG